MERNKKRPNISKVFKVAIEGIVYTFRYSKMMKIHYLIAIIMIIGSIAFELSDAEKLILIFAIALIIVSDMVNIAIEKTIDMITDENHELGEIARNVGAGGAVLATINALIATGIIFYDRLIPLIFNLK